MTAAHPGAFRSLDRTGVCGAGRSPPSQREIVTRPGFPSPNQPDRERTTAYRDSPEPDSSSDAHYVTIIGDCDEPSGESQFNTSRLKRPNGRRRVIYASGKLRGLRQTVPAQLPDLVYLDWQMRLVERLNELPIELICKPHPEGITAGEAHPLTNIGDVRSGRFEDLIPEADVFVLDVPHSTTFFWSALY